MQLLDDEVFATWRDAHPHEYLLNTWRPHGSGEPKLHRTTCPSLRELRPGATTWTAGDYDKFGGSKEELIELSRSRGRAASPCGICIKRA